MVQIKIQLKLKFIKKYSIRILSPNAGSYFLANNLLFSTDLDPSVCSQPGGKPGICKGAFQYFYYKEESGTCEPFIFGGCEAGSSDNKFPNIELCQRTCIDRASTDNILLY